MATKNTILPILTLFSIFLPLAISIDFNYPAVFNFGDSNSDTGELTVGLGFFLDPPNGQHYFKTSTGRFCDGRLIIDFLKESQYPPVSVSIIYIPTANLDLNVLLLF
uniref:GDSL esterase/lipase n=1 Tax=Quercus lobata TaxID=97700 RepID=A0A7N2L387_QUELO